MNLKSYLRENKEKIAARAGTACIPLGIVAGYAADLYACAKNGFYHPSAGALGGVAGGFVGAAAGLGVRKFVSNAIDQYTGIDHSLLNKLARNFHRTAVLDRDLYFDILADLALYASRESNEASLAIYPNLRGLSRDDASYLLNQLLLLKESSEDNKPR